MRRGRYGWSVLHFAAFKGFPRVCRKLVWLRHAAAPVAPAAG
jgi:hypothetical protein